MTSRILQAVGVAILLGAAAVAPGAPPFISAAYAVTVRPQVGNPLKEAVSLANAGKGAAAMAKVNQAAAVGGTTTSAEQSAIAQTKQFIAAKTGAGGSALGCKAKFATDYSVGRYRDVVGEDAACLRKSGGLDFNSQVVVAQAYFQMGDYTTAIRLLKGLGDSEQVLSVLMYAANKAGDTQTEGQVAERMVLRGQAKYWTYMLAAADSTRGLTDHENLDIHRIRYATGNMRNAEDYELMTELALQLHFPAEAVIVAQKGFDLKILQGERDARLLSKAQSDAAKDTPNLPNSQKKANASKSGDDLVSYGENLWGRGQYPDAVNAIQAGVAKGNLTKAEDAQISLGIAQLAAGQKDAAGKTFAGVKGTPAAQAVAHLWSVYARSGGTGTIAVASNSLQSSGTPKKRRH